MKEIKATSHLHIDQRNIPRAVQIRIAANKEIKKPQYIEKNQRPKNECLQVVLIELLKQVKNVMAWQMIFSDNVFFWHYK